MAINHVEAHLYSPLLALESESDRQASLPTVALIVSGGHTILAKASGIGHHEVLGHTVDDAAGEAFDKVAKLLRLPYPGGPEVEKLARQGNARAVEFPRGMMDDATFHFSFSGLKTAVLYYLQKHPGASLPDVCASFQEAVVEVLTAKTIRAAQHTGARTVSLAGGVAINNCLRERLQAECDRRGLRLLLAPPSLCTDNAGMVAALAYFKLRDGVKVVNDWRVDVAPSIGLGQGRN
jgi:N6-L-threonylcarbamoyladenine synthase